MKYTSFSIYSMLTFFAKERALATELGRSLADAGVLLPEDEMKLLHAHNKFRSDTALGKTGSHPMAMNMAKLKWDSTLAAEAKVWADKCDFSHEPGISVGENLYAAGSSGDSVDNIDTILNGLEKFYEEHSDYTYSDGSCTNICGHFTQLIWANTLSVGCAYAECTNIFPSQYPFQILLVCRYSPPGNWIAQKPYKETDDSNMVASICPSGYAGNAGSGLCEPVTDLPSSVPSPLPTANPSDLPTSFPSSNPSARPSDLPSNRPSNLPSAIPTTSPTSRPGDVPSDHPSLKPSSIPSAHPSTIPSSSPTLSPSESPTSRPSDVPSDNPSVAPSSIPSDHPSAHPSTIPSSSPTLSPSESPISRPSDVPSDHPSVTPSSIPSAHPSGSPTLSPSESPTSRPSNYPSVTLSPSEIPTSRPSRAHFPCKTIMCKLFRYFVWGIGRKQK